VSRCLHVNVRFEFEFQTHLLFADACLSEALRLLSTSRFASSSATCECSRSTTASAQTPYFRTRAKPATNSGLASSQARLRLLKDVARATSVGLPLALRRRTRAGGGSKVWVVRGKKTSS
jgi:hypothetical protein